MFSENLLSAKALEYISRAKELAKRREIARWIQTTFLWLCFPMKNLPWQNILKRGV